MKQTAGKAFARKYFYLNYLVSFMTPRQLRGSNFLTLLGEDFREIELLRELGVPSYRVFSVEREHAVYRRQQALNREDGHGAALYYGELSDFVSTHLRHQQISVFNLDICGSYLRAVDPVLGELLLHVRRLPHTVMATYSSAGRDRPQLMEGLKSLVLLLWLAPDVIDRLVRHIYGQYRSVKLSDSARDRDEISRNMLLRHMFWLRSHMEHIMLGAYSLGLTEVDSIVRAFASQEVVWKRFIASYEPSVSYGNLVRFVESLPRPEMDGVKMDIDFADVEFLTYAANDGFYHNCYFATFENTGASVSIDTWLVETAKTLRRNRLMLIDSLGRQYESTYGCHAVDTDAVRLWTGASPSSDLRQLAIPPIDHRLDSARAVDTDVEMSTVEHIRGLARSNPELSAREIAQRLSLQLPLQQVIAHVAVARRRDK